MKECLTAGAMARCGPATSPAGLPPARRHRLPTHRGLPVAPRGATARRLLPLSRSTPTEARVESSSASERDYAMPLLNFPLKPFTNRATVFKEVDPGRIYTLEQEQAFATISTNIRCTIIALRSGGLWVHCPVAPTRECIKFIRSIGKPVEYIVLPTFAIEHKIYLGPFARKFPDAQVWVSPKQWTWPINLPLLFLGVPRVDGVLEEGAETPWGSEIEHKVLVCAAGVGPFVEVDFFHRPTRTLLVTDAVVCVPERPPEVLDVYNSVALVESANDQSLDEENPEAAPQLRFPLEDSPSTRRRGWSIMALRVAFLKPIEGVEGTFKKLYGRLIVSPLIEILVFSKALPNVRRWCDEVTSEWNFKQIIPAHYDAPIKATPADLRRAFAFAYEDDERPAAASKGLLASLRFNLAAKPSRDVSLEAEKATLRQIDEALVSAGVAKRSDK